MYDIPIQRNSKGLGFNASINLFNKVIKQTIFFIINLQSLVEMRSLFVCVSA